MCIYYIATEAEGKKLEYKSKYVPSTVRTVSSHTKYNKKQ